MAIKLPKDAEGREIPLDTVALYDDDGNVHSVRRFIYTTDFDLGDKRINSWIAVVDDYKTAKPEQMHLTSPDSWKKLEEDLDRAAKADAFRACRYANDKMRPCNECRFLNKKGLRLCDGKALAEILDRVRKLRGED